MLGAIINKLFSKFSGNRNDRDFNFDQRDYYDVGKQ